MEARKQGSAPARAARAARAALVSLGLAGLAAAWGSCAPVPAREPAEERGAGAAATPGAPTPRAPNPEGPGILAAAPERGYGELAIAWRPDHPGGGEAGEGRLLWRFGGEPGGRLLRILESVEAGDGEAILARLDLSRIGGESLLSRLPAAGTARGPDGGSAGKGATLRTDGSGGIETLAADGTRTRYAREPSGGLRIERDHGDWRRIEVWDAAGGAGIHRDGVLLATGRLEPGPGGTWSYLERRADDPEAMDELEYRVVERGGVLEAKLGGAEPIAGILAIGLADALSGEAGLGNLALVELALGPERRLTPLLVRALLALD